MPAGSGSRLAPTVGQERDEFLDVLRGFSLAGIVLANMVSLSLYLYLPPQAAHDDGHLAENPRSAGAATSKCPWAASRSQPFAASSRGADLA
jgi:hypothetical protein